MDLLAKDCQIKRSIQLKDLKEASSLSGFSLFSLKLLRSLSATIMKLRVNIAY
jgi:hypothetical protein